jgi:hypothetical protein
VHDLLKCIVAKLQEQNPLRPANNPSAPGLRELLRAELLGLELDRGLLLPQVPPSRSNWLATAASFLGCWQCCAMERLQELVLEKDIEWEVMLRWLSSRIGAARSPREALSRDEGAARQRAAAQLVQIALLAESGGAVEALDHLVVVLTDPSKLRGAAQSGAS